MEKEIEHLYTKKQAEQLRQKLIGGIESSVKKRFQEFLQLRSVAMFVAQYWDDEAGDAVHVNLIYSVLDTPDLETATKAKDIPDPINLPEFSRGAVWELKRDHYNTWPENHEAIPAFAAFCKEGAHQGMDFSEAYTLYAVLRRQGKDIEVEVVGTMLRPWLDGIKPEWE